MRKLLSLCLALMLVMSVFTVSLAEEPTVLSIYYKGSNSDQFETGVFAEAEKRLNVELEFTYFDDDSFAAMLAGGDLGDIILSGNDVPSILASGLALDLNPYIDEYLPNLKIGSAAAAANLCRELASTDGGLYLLPPVVGLHLPVVGGLDPRIYRGYVVRWDYYKELGCPEINNDDDYIAVLQQMLENHPTNEDGTPNLLFGCKSGSFNMGAYRSAFKSDVALNPWGNYQYDNDIFTNELYDGYLDVEHSGYWDNMVFLNKIYRLGLFDEDCFTMTSDEFTAKMAAGKYMGVMHADDALYNANVEKDPNTDITYMVVPSEGMINYANVNLVLGNMPSNYMMIFKDSENIEAACSLINLMYDLDFMRYAYSGVQGVDWDYDENGVPRMTETAIQEIANQDPKWSYGAGNGGLGQRINTIFGYNPATLHTDGYPLQLTMQKDTALSAQQPRMLEICKTYDVEYWTEAYTAVEKDFRNDVGELIAACITNTSLDDRRILEACEDVLEASLATMIMSESDEEFAMNQADVLAELEALGEAEVFERYKAEYDRIKDVMVPQHIAAMEANGIELYPGLE